VLEAVSVPAFLPAVRERGARLRSGLQRIAAQAGGTEVRGRGLLLALDLPQPEQATRVAEWLRQRATAETPGVLVNAVRPQRLRFVPALTITDDEIDLALDLLEQAVPATT
jgi:acetylornithine/N-succinyldiaminopimelate aminotransferase